MSCIDGHSTQCVGLLMRTFNNETFYELYNIYYLQANDYKLIIKLLKFLGSVIFCRSN